MKIVLIILSIIPAVLITIIPFFGKISDNRRKGFKKFTNRGYLLIFCCVFGSIASASLILWEDYENDKTEKQLNTTIGNLKHELVKRDSVNKAHKDSTDLRLYEAFAKYGLKYDQSRQEISKLIRDSANLKIIAGEIPTLFISSMELNDSLNELSIMFKSKNATSYNINVRYALFSKDSLTNKIKLDFPEKYIFKNFQIPNEMGLEETIIMRHYHETHISTYYVRMLGTYEKWDGTKISVDNFYGLEINNRFINPDNFEIEEMKKIRSNYGNLGF